MTAAAAPSADRPPLSGDPPSDDRREWVAFKQRFVTADGRVIDTGNRGISHSEGQGFGLFFAASYDDRQSFERILHWTSRTLRRPSDALHAWRYIPWAAKPVADLNNATDGDLFIAFALSLAARRWGEPDHRHAAAAIARDIRRLAVRHAGSRIVLLPGADGFEKPAAVVINPSYYVFPALAEMARLERSSDWDRLVQDGQALIAEGRFGHWRLPPDWLLAPRSSGRLEPAPGWPPRFSYDAIRIPLYLAWGRIALTVVEADFLAYWDAFPPPRAPAWIDLESGTIAPYAASPGMLAVRQFAAHVWNGFQLTESLPRVASSPDYYSAALTLLARTALHERRA